MTLTTVVLKIYADTQWVGRNVERSDISIRTAEYAKYEPKANIFDEVINLMI